MKVCRYCHSIMQSEYEKMHTIFIGIKDFIIVLKAVQFAMKM